MNEEVVYALFSPKWGWMLDHEGEERFTTPDRAEAECQAEWGKLEGENWRVYWWLEC